MTNSTEQQYWAGAPFSTLLSQINQSLKAKESLIIIEGAKGSGKSALANALKQSLLDNQDAVILIDQPPASNTELQRMCREQQSALGDFAFMVALEKYLLQLNQDHKRCVLIIDNAEQLNAEVITGIRMMANLQSATHRLLQVVMLGSDALLKLLNHPQSGGLNQRISLHAKIPALKAEQLKQMLFDLYGLSLTDGALDALDKLAKGRPEYALKTGQLLVQLDIEGPIGRSQLHKAIGQNSELSKIRSKQRLSLLSPLMVIAALGGSFWLYTQKSDTAPPQQSIAAQPQPSVDDKQNKAETVKAEPTTVQTTTVAVKEPSKQNNTGIPTLNERQSAPIDDLSKPDAQPQARQQKATPVTTEPLPTATDLTPQIAAENHTEQLQDTPLPLEQVLSQTIIRWIDAWQRKDIGGYFDAYTPTFTPTNGASHQQWRADRTDRILAIEWMRMSMGELEIIDHQDDQLIVRVWLNYASPGYQDQTLKELNMVKIGGRWLIEEERNKVVKRGDLVLTPEPEEN